MPSVHVFWTEKGLNFDEDSEYEIDEREIHTGVLTDGAEHASEEVPVVVEDLTGRVYLPGDFPPDTILYVESAPGGMPAIAEAAAEAGYNVAHAEERGLVGPEVNAPPREDPADPATE
jgi:hypothetical protein